MNDNKNESNVIKESRKNVCSLCGKKLMDQGEELAACIKFKNGKLICFSCAYSIEVALEASQFDWGADYYYEDEQDSQNIKRDVTPKEPVLSNNEKSIFLDKNTVIKEIQKSVIGQDETVVRVVNILYRNFLSKNSELKSTPLLIGKSGHGKTEIISEFCKLLNVPFVFENAKDFSEAGYVGRTPMEMFTDLYKYCGEDSKLASQGIVVIDEIDKLREVKGEGRDVSGAGVVNTLLSYISGVKVPIKDKYDNIVAYIDTKDIKFIFMGAFEEADESESLYNIREKRLDTGKKMGFSTGVENVVSMKDVQKNFIAEDLMKYGFSRQFVGRVSIIELNELTEEDFMKIMLKSKISIYRAFEREFASYGVKMICSKKLKQNIVKKAISKKIGVRGLKVVCEETFLTALEEVENMKKVKYTTVIFKDDAIDNSKNYVFK